MAVDPGCLRRVVNGRVKPGHDGNDCGYGTVVIARLDPAMHDETEGLREPV
jgi:hypothetical protein